MIVVCRHNGRRVTARRRGIFEDSRHIEDISIHHRRSQRQGGGGSPSAIPRLGGGGVCVCMPAVIMGTRRAHVEVGVGLGCLWSPAKGGEEQVKLGTVINYSS